MKRVRCGVYVLDREQVVRKAGEEGNNSKKFEREKMAHMHRQINTQAGKSFKWKMC